MTLDDVVADVEIVPVVALGEETLGAVDELRSRYLRIVCWIFFGVGFAWIPFVIDLLAGTESEVRLDLTSVLSHGELALVSAVITAGALGDLISAIANTRRYMIRKVAVAGLLMLNFASTAMYYAVLRFRGNTEPSELNRVAQTSLVFFGCAFVISLSALVLAEKQD